MLPESEASLPVAFCTVNEDGTGDTERCIITPTLQPVRQCNARKAIESPTRTIGLISTSIRRNSAQLYSIRARVPQLRYAQRTVLATVTKVTCSRQKVLIDILRIQSIEVPRVVCQRLDMGHEVQVARHVRQRDRAVRRRRKREEAEATPEFVGGLRPMTRTRG